MNQARVVYHLARADFLERVRRYSFIIMLGLVMFLGYQSGIGNLALELGAYRGEYNSAWVGAMMSLIAAFFLGWFGFYLVKGSVNRDRETGVGQIMATTPLTSPLYLIGKWLSNFAVLMAMVAVLALAGIVIQLLQGENTQINLPVFLAPFFYIVTPLMGLVAAVAVLFEAIPFLQGGFGNIVYFFAFIMVIPLFIENKAMANYAAFEPMGLVLLANDMGTAVTKVHPDYSGGFSLGSGGEEIRDTFIWTGIHWTPNFIFARFTLIALAVALTLLAALFFDRFDPSRRKPAKLRIRKNASIPAVSSILLPPPMTQPASLTPLTASTNHFVFFRVLISELKLLLKGQRWWWYAVAGGLFIAGLVNKPEIARQFILPFTWLWPILLWSGLGSREIQHNAHQMVFSSAAPLWRQLPASWLAGFLVTVITGSGVAIKLLSVGDAVGLLAWISAALFIPSFALASGVWTNSHKVFEVVYVALWYLGPMNKIAAVDYPGANSNGNIGFFLPLSLALIVAAFIGRARQLQN